MRLASYMRGLGIGMAATALILHFSAAGDTKASGTERNITPTEAASNLRLSESGTGVVSVTPTLAAGSVTDLTGAAETAEEDKNEKSVSDDIPLLLPGLSGNEAEVPEGLITPAPSPEAEADPTGVPTATKVPTATRVPTATKAIEPTATKAVEPTATKAAEPTATPSPTPSPAPTPTKAPTPTPVPVTTPTQAASSNTQVSLNTQEQEVVVVSGDDSYSVSRKMADAGIIPSAAEFDKYMCANGYDRRIATGIHKIPANCSYQRICEILTKKAR